MNFGLAGKLQEHVLVQLQNIRIVIQATDGGTNSLVEVVVDDVRIERATG